MVNFPGRNDRRRRVLKEEVLSASGSRSALRTTTEPDSVNQGPRYSEAAGVENHPQVTDFVPRRYATVALLVAIGGAATSLLAAIHYFALPIAVAHGMASTAAFDLGAQGNLTTWLAAIVLFMAAGFCVMTYSIRRHRIDDIRGRYRVWLGAALACLVASANSVTGLHQALADVLGQLTGWTALRDGAAWWIAIAGLPLAWIFIRVLLDMRECFVAAALLMGAFVCYGVCGARFLGFGPVVEARIEPIVMGAPLILGHWLVFAAVVAYARFVVLDAQGLVTVRRRTQAKKPARAAVAKQTSDQPAKPAVSAPVSLATIEFARQTAQASKRSVDTSRWLDGTRPERKHYDEDEDDDESSDGDRKVSKSERKRLRKLKTQNRAA